MCPLSSRASTPSSTDSTALVTNRQPVAARRGSSVGVPQQVLDLDGDVVGQAGNSFVQRVDDAQRVRRAVEEVGIAEGHVLGALAATCAAMSASTTSSWHDPELPVVDRHDRAVPAQMLAAAAGLRVAGQTGVARRRAAPYVRAEAGCCGPEEGTRTGYEGPDARRDPDPTVHRRLSEAKGSSSGLSSRCPPMAHSTKGTPFASSWARPWSYRPQFPVQSA